MHDIHDIDLKSTSDLTKIAFFRQNISPTTSTMWHQSEIDFTPCDWSNHPRPQSCIFDPMRHAENPHGPCASGSKSVRKFAPTTVTTGLVWALQWIPVWKNAENNERCFFFRGGGGRVKKGRTSLSPSWKEWEIQIGGDICSFIWIIFATERYFVNKLTVSKPSRSTDRVLATLKQPSGRDSKFLRIPSWTGPSTCEAFGVPPNWI